MELWWWWSSGGVLGRCHLYSPLVSTADTLTIFSSVLLCTKGRTKFSNQLVNLRAFRSHACFLSGSSDEEKVK